MKKLFFVALCVYLTVQVDSAKILAVFTFPSISHQVVFRTLVLELVNQGHEVVTITTDPAFPPGQGPANLTEIDIGETSYKAWRDHVVDRPDKSDDYVQHMRKIYESVVYMTDAQFQDPNVLDLINDRNRTFDLLLIEACQRPTLIFTHIFKAPVIQVSSFTGVPFNYKTMGLSTHTFLYPSPVRQRFYNLTLWEKATEFFKDYLVQSAFYELEEEENRVIRKRLGPSMPRLSDLQKNVHMLFLNAHPIFEGIRPVTPSVVYIGGIHQNPQKPLPEDLQAYLDSAKNGVIYVSFGTNVEPSKFPPEKLQAMVRVFSQLPYEVLWKWNLDELPGKADNIKFFKWLPQSDLLRHPNVKLYIMQGGIQSTDEAITAGVPMIGVPMLGDQWYNIDQYVRHKIGLRLDLENINEKVLMDAITTILGDDSYRRNIIKLRSLIYDQPQKPLDRALWWIEYILRNGGAEHLKSPAANMSWWDYLELDLVLVVIAILSVTIALSVAVLYYLYAYVSRNFTAKLKIKRT